MAYLAIVIIPVIIAVTAVLSPVARQEMVNIAHSGVERTASAIEKVRKNPNILEAVNNLEHRVAAYLLRQAADSVDKK